MICYTCHIQDHSNALVEPVTDSPHSLDNIDVMAVALFLA